MQQDFSISSYDFHLPDENIAQKPADQRQLSRLLTLNRDTNKLKHEHFFDIINYFEPGDLLIVNNTRVFPARLLGRKATGGKVEVFLLEYPQADTFEQQEVHTKSVPVLIKSSKRPQPGSTVTFGSNFSCTIQKLLEGGKAVVQLHYPANNELAELLHQHGQMPLPPYISRKEGSTEEDRVRYQTVYADKPGAVAAPTAGLHFTDELIQTLQHKGVQTTSITLHVGYGTFSPVRVDNIQDHKIHAEFATISAECANLINETKLHGKRVWAVGTTTVRTLEYAARETGKVVPIDCMCDLYITPGFTFNVVDRLITNFHLPQSSLLFLVSAFCGRKRLLESYAKAIEKGYRFYSYGDAMVIL